MYIGKKYKILRRKPTHALSYRNSLFSISECDCNIKKNHNIFIFFNWLTMTTNIAYKKLITFES